MAEKDPKGSLGQEALGQSGKKAVEGIFESLEKGQDKAIKKATAFEKTYERALKHIDKAAKIQSGNSSGSSLGLGSMGPGALSLQNGTYGQGGGMSGGQIAGRVALGLGAAAYGILPSTTTAVGQRLAAEQIAMYSRGSGGARNVITSANAAVGRGNATSAMGPTLAAGQVLSQGGYSQNSMSARNIMGQLGGMSAASGMTNEGAAGAYASQNSMVLLRLGIRLRDGQGNLRPPDQVVNDLYNRLYSGANPKNPEEMFSPNSIDHKTIMAAAGGSPEVFQLYAGMLMLRYKKKKPLTSKDMGSAKGVLSTMGVKNGLQATNFNYQSSQNRLLQGTEQGAVAGYQGALNAAAAVNNGMSALAETLPGVVNGLAALKGVLETLPAAGGAGAVMSGAGSAIGTALALRAGGLLKGGTAAGSFAAGTYGSGALKTASGFAKGASKAIPVLGTALSMYGGYQAGKSKQGFSFSEMLKAAGIGAAGGAAVGSLGAGVGAVPGAVIGALLSGGGNAIGQLFGANQGGGSSTKALGTEGSGPLLLNPGEGFRVSSAYGTRKDPNGGATQHHNGTDYAMPVGTPVLAAADGIVDTVTTQAGSSRSYGLYVVLRHEGFYTYYAHLSKVIVKVGDQVRQGQTIALSGGAKGAPGAGSSTGPHLHFEVKKTKGGGGQDPKGWFGKVKSSIAGLFKSKKDSTADMFEEFNLRSPSGLGQGYSSSSVLGGTRLAQLLSQGSSIGYGDLAGGRLGFAQAHGSQDAQDYFAGADRLGSSKQHTPVSGDSGSMAFGSRVGLMQALHARGFRGKALSTAFAVALAESGGRATATNATNDHGLFQINMGGALGKERLAKTWKNSMGATFKLNGLKDLYNPTTNTDIAYHMSNKGSNWSSWVAYKNGAFTNFLDDAETTARKAGIKVGFYGADRTEEGLTYTHKDEVLMTKMEADRIRNRPSSSGGGLNVTMNVNIAKASDGEVQVLLQRFKAGIEQSGYLDNIGGY
jgi:murein DD-endopeptidase MepM/ murein hydrolase activator NlpD